MLTTNLVPELLTLPFVSAPPDLTVNVAVNPLAVLITDAAFCATCSGVKVSASAKDTHEKRHTNISTTLMIPALCFIIQIIINKVYHFHHVNLYSVLSAI